MSSSGNVRAEDARQHADTQVSTATSTSLRPAQFADQRPAAGQQRALQLMAQNGTQARQDAGLKTLMDQHAELHAAPVQKKNTGNGLPDDLRSGIETLSGMPMDHVRVHYNSPQPAQLQAHDYAQGSHIHVAPGAEQHLPHEAWHVVQQAQGRVAATAQMDNGIQLNDDNGLEREADRMGELAGSAAAASPSADMPVQRWQPGRSSSMSYWCGVVQRALMTESELSEYYKSNSNTSDKSVSWKNLKAPVTGSQSDRRITSKDKSATLKKHSKYALEPTGGGNAPKVHFDQDVLLNEKYIYAKKACELEDNAFVQTYINDTNVTKKGKGQAINVIYCDATESTGLGTNVLDMNGEVKTEIKFSGIEPISKTGKKSATQVDAIIGPDHQLGSKPDINYRDSDKIKRKYTKDVVAMHLLNSKLGGPGIQQNLTPGTSSANAAHSNQVENTLKKLVNDDLGFVQYTSKVNFENDYPDTMTCIWSQLYLPENKSGEIKNTDLIPKDQHELTIELQDEEKQTQTPTLTDQAKEQEKVPSGGLAKAKVDPYFVVLDEKATLKTKMEFIEKNNDRIQNSPHVVISAYLKTMQNVFNTPDLDKKVSVEQLSEMDALMQEMKRSYQTMRNKYVTSLPETLIMEDEENNTSSSHKRTHSQYAEENNDVELSKGKVKK